MNSVFNISTFLKTLVFIFLCTLTVSTALAEVEPPETVADYAGKGLASQIMLTKQEQAWLDRRLTVRVRVAATPPFLMTNPGPQGISVDYLKAIGKRFGINFIFAENSQITWKEAVNDLTGERKFLDVIPFITRTPAREQSIAFTRDYFSSPWVIINRTDTEFVTRMEDLNGKKVAAENGFVIMDLIKNRYPQIRIVPVTSTLDALNSIASGASDAYIGNLTIASYFIQSHGLNNLRIAAPTPFGSHDIAAGVRRDWPELARIINKGLTAMSVAEESEIRSRWLSVRYEYGINMKKVLIWAVGLTALSSLVIATFFIWNRRLRREITSRIMAEEASKKSEALLQSTSKIANIGGWEFDVRSMDLKWTEEVYRIFEVDSDFIPSVQAAINFYAPEARPVISQAVQRSIEDGESFDLELPIITANGNRRFIHAVGEAQSRDGIHKTVRGIIQDITSQKQAQAALRHSEEKFRTLVTNLSSGVVVHAPDSSIIFSNPMASTLLGLSTDQMLGKKAIDPAWCFLRENGMTLPLAEYPVNRVLSSGKPVVNQVLGIRHPDLAEPVWVQCNSYPDTAADGTLLQVVVTFSNITERMQTEEAQHQSRRAALNMMTDAVEARERAEQLNQQIGRLNTELEQRVVERTAELEVANRELEAFCYSVSHDLRAPLRHVDGYVELLVSRCRADLSDKGLHYLDTIAASARQMGVLIDDLLQFSRTGRAEMRRENTDMNQALQEALTTLRESSAGRSIEWTINELPAVSADHALLRQVWVNLLDNAIKYSRTREVARITVSASKENGEIIFSVADNGVGFDMQYVGKLFGVFQRLHSLEEFEGTGIGLATVQRIINRHGGRIWAEAELDRGATFYFTLPG